VANTKGQAMGQPVTITLNSEGEIADVDFVQWALNEIADKAFNRQQVADTYAILLQKGAATDDIRRINEAILNRWSPSGLRWIKEQSWKQVNR
jgi:hypothetical protein